MKTDMRAKLLASTLFVGAAMLATPALAREVPTGPQDEATTDDTTVDDTTPDAEVTGETVVVTGTLISNPNLQAASPVSVIGEDEINLRQANVAEELLRELPGAVPSIGSAVNNGNGGASFANLRGIGSNRNITLLDGVRLTPGDLNGRVDLNNIPLALVQRVDVLTGGASSTYGADAVGGVINFITRNDFAGFDANVSEQITERGDGNFLRADVTMGANFDDGRGNAVFSLGYQESDPVYFGGPDRPLSQVTLESYDEFFVAGQGSSTTTPSALDIGGGRARQQITADGTGISPFYRAYNFNPYNVFQVPFKRYNMYGAAHYDVADNITAYTRGLYSNNTVSTIIAPSGVFGSSVTVPVSNPFMTAAQRTYLCANADTNTAVAGNQTLTATECAAAAVATSPTDPNYRTFTFGLRRRTPEVGPRVSEFNTQIFDYRLGLRGNITDSITFDVYGAYGQSKNTQSINGYVLLSRVRQALLATNTTSCLNTANNCVPLNIFGAPGSITAGMADFINDSAQTVTESSLAQARALVSGDFGWNLWAADPVSFAVGTEFRKYTAAQRSDALAKTAGELGGAGGAAPDINGGFDVYEAFGELVVPIVSDRPFFDELTLQTGVRQSHYTVDAAGSPKFDTTTWKVEGSWAPIEDIRFRGNYQRAVRAPNISELFSPVSTGLTNLGTDPCQGGAPVSNANLRAICIAQGAPAATIGFITAPTAGQANITSGGNLNVGPETATTWTAGVVLNPSFLPGFSATVDYYNIKVDDAITTPTPADLIAACFGNITGASATNPACTAIRRNPITGGLDGDPATTPGLYGALSNLGVIKTDGIDLSLSYATDLGMILGQKASLALNFNGNWTHSSKFQATPTSIDRECVGYYSPNCGSIQPEFFWTQRTTFTMGDIDLSLLWRHQGEANFEPLQYQEDLAAAVAAGAANCPNPTGTDAGGCVVDPRFRHIAPHDYFDLSTRFNVSEELTLTVSVQNLFDINPPTVGGTVGSTSYNGGNTYPSSYDALGRRYAVSARLRF